MPLPCKRMSTMESSQSIRILIMENDAAQARRMQQMLEHAGYAAERARDGDEGLRMFRAGPYDLLLVNHQMPGQSGIEVVRLLNLRGEPTPIVMVIGPGEEEVAVEAMKLGVGDYIVQDLDGRYLTLLPIRIEKLLAQQRLAEEKQQAETSLHQALEALEVWTADLQRVNAQLHAEMTERVQTEELFRGLVESAPDAIVIINQDGQIILVNAQTEAMFGYARHELYGQPVECLVPDHLRRAHTAHRRHYIAQPTVRHMGSGLDLFGLHKDGRQFPVEISLSPLETADGLLISSAIRDMTERKQAEQVHQRLEAHLRQSQKMEALGTLAGGIAHAFNNILTVILGFTQLAQSAVQEQSPVRSYLQHVFEAGSQAKDLVEQIVAFSRQGEQERTPLAVALVVQEVLTLLRASLPSTIEIRQHLHREEGMVRANRTQLYQAILNLCANAEHAMRETGGVLDIGVDLVDLDDAFAVPHPSLQLGPHVRLTVRDTGSGLAPDLIEHVFEPFFTTKDVGEGSGMGLAIVHGIVTSHGGAITVESLPGEGTTFSVYFPRVDGCVGSTGTVGNHESRTVTHSPHPPNWS